jgi:uncharacterized iron-regulated protein
MGRYFDASVATRAAARAAGLLIALGAASGCARQQSLDGVGFDWQRNVEPEPKPEPRRPRKDVPPETVEAAALPFYGIRASDCQPLTGDELLAELAKLDAVCVGEHHDDPHHHWAQLRITTDLVERATHSGRELGIGFEMFDRTDQPLLAKWEQQKLDTEALLEQSHWERDWGYPFGFYRPLLDVARQRQLGVVALNAPRDVTRRIARGGLDALDDKQRDQLPELDFGHAEHRAAFEQAMKEHPHGGADPDNLYAAQVVWDETMAHSAVDWLRVRRPTRQLVIAAGLMHCRASAVPGRIERRLHGQAAAVVPVVQTSDSDPKQALEGFDYAFVMTKPE